MTRFLSPALLAVLLAAPLAGCDMPETYPASQYRYLRPAPPVLLTFAPGGDEPSADPALLREVSASLPAQVAPEFHAAGPMTSARAASLRRILGRPVRVLPPLPQRMRGPDTAVLVFPVQPGIVADSCLEPGQPVIGGFIPWDESNLPRLLPEGCAVATSIQVQAVSGGSGNDLLRGRQIAPGASQPFADAAEAYYRRNDSGQRLGGGAGRTGGADANSSPLPVDGAAAGGGSGQAAPAGVNPLLGPLPGSPPGPAAGAPTR